jgi:hypothetical protein
LLPSGFGKPASFALNENYAAQPPLALPDKPSLAVLPFTNMSGDPEQEFVSDGIAEDVISALSHYPSLFVIARNSTFTKPRSPTRAFAPGVPLYKRRSRSFTAPLAIAAGKNWMHPARRFPRKNRPPSPSFRH